MKTSRAWQRRSQLADCYGVPRHATHNDHDSDAYSLLMAVDVHGMLARLNATDVLLCYDVARQQHTYRAFSIGDDILLSQYITITSGCGKTPPFW